MKEFDIHKLSHIERVCLSKNTCTQPECYEIADTCVGYYVGPDILDFRLEYLCEDHAVEMKQLEKAKKDGS